MTAVWTFLNSPLGITLIVALAGKLFATAVKNQTRPSLSTSTVSSGRLRSDPSTSIVVSMPTLICRTRAASRARSRLLCFATFMGFASSLTPSKESAV